MSFIYIYRIRARTIGGIGLQCVGFKDLIKFFFWRCFVQKGVHDCFFFFIFGNGVGILVSKTRTLVNGTASSFSLTHSPFSPSLPSYVCVFVCLFTYSY